MSSNTVTISAGTHETLKSWTLSEDLLCDHSPYFRAAFKGSFEERRMKELHFQELDPSGFPHLVDWMYTGKLKCREFHGCRNCDGERECPDHRNTHGISFYSLYVLADFLIMPELATKALGKIRTCLGICEWLPSRLIIIYTYNNSGEESPLRKLLVNEFVKAFLIGRDFDFNERIGASWTGLVSSDKEFHLSVMAEIKQHTHMEYCSLRNCSIHNRQNGIRERRLQRQLRNRRRRRA